MPSPGETTAYSAHGKLLLFGEHAAVYGYPALGTSLPLSLEIRISPGMDSSHQSPLQPPLIDGQFFPGLNREEEEAAGQLLETAETLNPQIRFPAASYILEGNIPRSSGFGSSAALCVAFARYINSLWESTETALVHVLPNFQHGWSETEQRQYLLWHIANELEKVFHGSPSGIDTGLAIHSGLTAFFPRSRRLPDILPLPSPQSDIWIIYGSVPRVGNTKELVGRIQKGMLEERPKIVDAVGNLGEIAHQAIDLFAPQQSDRKTEARQISETLGSLADKAGEQLKALKLNSPDMDRILDKARKLGAGGGKLSGAGGGGAFWISAVTEDQAKDLREQLTAFAMNKHIKLSEPLSIATLK